jgi:predicted nucleic acid-binding protein
MKSFTLDASVIIKWVAGSENEPDHDKAMAVLNAWTRGTVELFVPSLWQYEVGNFLGRQLPATAGEKMGFLIALRMTDVPLSQDMYINCFTWMKQKKITFYDAVYLATAARTKSILLTVDEKFVKSMADDRTLLLSRLKVDVD